MINFIKKSIKNILHRNGLHLSRVSIYSSPGYEINRVLDYLQIDLVFDIGANIGQFGIELRREGYAGRIVSFEPLPDAYIRLKKVSHSDQKWYVHKRVALGDIAGNESLNVSNNSVSSSFLPMKDKHSESAPNSLYVGSVMVDVIMLDEVAEIYIENNNHIFIKIDSQGFESKIIDGARNTLSKAKAVLCELSLVELYEGQELWIEMIRKFEELGFHLWTIQKGFSNPLNGQTLQVDAIFIRR